jgi:hypothetical protein
LEIYERFPDVLDVSHMNAEEFKNTWGIWVSSAITNQTLLSRHPASQLLRIAAGSVPPGIAVRRSTDPTVSTGENILPLLTTCVDGSQGDGEELAPQPNLWLTGQFDGGGSGFSRGVQGNLTGGTDVTSGYSLQQLTADAAGGTVGYTSANWGAGQASGLYTFSAYVKVNYPVTVLMGYRWGGVSGTQVNVRNVTLGPAAGFQRIWFAFYYDASVTYAMVLSVPIAGSGTLVLGLPCMTLGSRPAPYVMAGAAQAATILATYYLASGDSPPPGPNRVGDQIVHTDPSPSGFAGRVCTAAGSPGTWRTWGLIS